MKNKRLIKMIVAIIIFALFAIFIYVGYEMLIKEFVAKAWELIPNCVKPLI